jgi:CDP-diacylglycerol---glycerol-3-phosphate 3-phosphatidyltransferase
MNLPNKITISRLVMAPLFFIAFFLPSWFGEGLSNLSTVLVLLLFVLTEVSDLLDGYIARKYKLITDLGKVMDPFADTFSRLTYFVCLSAVGVMPVWTFIIIMWREFSMVFLRMLMMGRGKAVPANIWGKSKAVLYAVSGVLGILFVACSYWFTETTWLEPVGFALKIVFGLAAFASVASFLTYVRAIVREKGLSHLSK